ncbi:TPA: hypothetical protein ACHIYL_004513, partial [Escherichia coli]
PAVKRRSLIPIPHKICRSFISSPLLFFVAMLTFPERANINAPFLAQRKNVNPDSNMIEN